ncbi:MAG: orotate phosphoribosyltransferase [Candidatus Gracilibacteria bacterium]
MKQYKKDFIQFLVKAEALKFGEFTLKSGRKAPYFLNVGSFYTGEFAHQLGKFYAEAFLDTGVEAEVIFGPAYKGIPLSVLTVEALYDEHKKNLAYTFNRKEAKDHGEGKVLVGAPLSENTRVMLIDDVVTAGTAVRETVEILKANGNPKIVGVLIAMNRMEKNNEGKNAIAELEETLGAKVYSIVDLDDVVEALKDTLGAEKMAAIGKYRAEYGV